MRTIHALIPIALLPPCQAAGRRVAAVVPSCRSELASLERDVEGDEDRCVATAAPRCEAGERLGVDSNGRVSLERGRTRS